MTQIEKGMFIKAFDGEGSVSVKQGKYLEMLIWNSDYTFLQQEQASLGEGTIRLHARKGQVVGRSHITGKLHRRKKNLYCLNVPKAVVHLRWMFPHLSAKRQAQVEKVFEKIGAELVR